MLQFLYKIWLFCVRLAALVYFQQLTSDLYQMIRQIRVRIGLPPYYYFM